MITINLPKIEFDKTLRVITERPDALWGERDTKAMMDRITRKAKTGKTGFTFRTDYSEPYATKYKKKIGNYMKKSGTMLRSVAYRQLRRGNATIWQLYFTDSKSEEVAYLHSKGLAKGCKIRKWFDLSNAEKNAINKTVEKRLKKLLKN